ncbi:MAG: hypothetical protein OEV87_11095 [Phycisphaerae bacterium]|nr:hypothetical protein [Phycisphaerae bacterium]
MEKTAEIIPNEPILRKKTRVLGLDCHYHSLAVYSAVYRDFVGRAVF